MTLEIERAVDDGREFWVLAAVEGRSIRGVVPRELLDDEIGDQASKSDREAWIRENSRDIEMALVALEKGGSVFSPFHRIARREAL